MVKIGNSVCAFFIIFSASWCSPDVLNPLGSTFWIASRSKGSHFLAGENLTAIRATTPDGDEEAVKTRWLPNPPCAHYISGFSPPGGGGSGSTSRGEGGPRQWQIWRSAHPCVLSAVLLLYRHNGPAGLSLTLEGGGAVSGLGDRRRAVRLRSKTANRWLSCLACTQQAEVITHMGGADCMTSWWNHGDLLCCKNNRGH